LDRATSSYIQNDSGLDVEIKTEWTEYESLGLDCVQQRRHHGIVDFSDSRLAQDTARPDPLWCC
jgi:hypothetical protein